MSQFQGKIHSFSDHDTWMQRVLGIDAPTLRVHDGSLGGSELPRDDARDHYEDAGFELSPQKPTPEMPSSDGPADGSDPPGNGALDQYRDTGFVLKPEKPIPEVPSSDGSVNGPDPSGDGARTQYAPLDLPLMAETQSPDMTQRDTTALRPPMPPEYDITHAAFGTLIKGGAFGKVSWLKDTSGPSNLVIKIPHGEKQKRELHNEAVIYAKIPPHPNVVRSFGLQTVDGQEGLVLEGIEGLDMARTMHYLDRLEAGDAEAMKAFGLTKAMSHTVATGVRQYIMGEVLKGLAHFEDSGIVHTDIRPDNIMIDKRTGAVKIVDVGLAYESGQVMPADGQAPIRQGMVSPEQAASFLKSQEISRMTEEERAALPARTDGVTPSADMFGVGELARKPGEGAVFDYGGKAGSYASARAFGEPAEKDSEGKATAWKQALNPLGAPGTLAEQRGHGTLEERIAEVDARVETLAQDPALAAIKVPDAVRKKFEEAKARELQAQREAEAEGRPYMPRVFPESALRTPVEDLQARVEALKARCGAPDLSETDRDGLVAQMETLVGLAESRLKRSGGFRANTAYTDFVNKAMHPDPQQRLKPKEALAHDFITKPAIPAQDAIAPTDALRVLHALLNAPALLTKTADQDGASDSDSDSGSDSSTWSSSGWSSDSSGSSGDNSNGTTPANEASDRYAGPGRGSSSEPSYESDIPIGRGSGA